MSSIARVIEENCHAIAEELVSTARREMPGARQLSHEELLDSLYEFLKAIAGAVRRGEPSPHAIDFAREHGAQRWWIGYELRSLILEYGVLRRIILRRVLATGYQPPLEEIDALTQALTLSVADAVGEYVATSERSLGQALDRARQATKAREDVLAIISHDLKNPLQVLHSGVHLLLHELSSPGFPANQGLIQRRLEAMQRATERMNRLVTDILDLARMKAGETKLTYVETTSGEILRQLADAVAPAAEQRSIHLRLEASLDCRIHCDRDRILQVLENLVSNAIKFSPVGASVRIIVAESDDSCVFEVHDDGPGIPPESLTHLFQPYWQASATAKQGTGLGLSIARALVDLHGGKIWAESEVGKGSTFAVRLPREAPRVEGEDPETPLAQPR